MTLSGPDALRSLEEALRDVRREEDDISKRLARSAELVAKARETEGQLFRKLAEVRLDPATQSELTGRLSAAELKARSVQKSHGAALTAAEQDLAELDRTIGELSTQRAETLKLVAQHADANNVGGTLDNVRRKERILLEHCERVGRDPAEIERTTGRGTVVIRDSRTEAQRVLEHTFDHNGHAAAGSDQPVGTPEDIAERLLPFVELGYRHLIFGFPHPYDVESMTRLIREVKPRLEAGR